jgi:hypothetical protein
MLAVTLMLVIGIAAGAQDKKGDQQLRTVHGSVLDKNENPVTSAVVYLKNGKTLSVKTYISDDTGHYRFSGLDVNVDYEIHAEHNDMMSAVHTISSFDDRRDIPLTLKLNKKQESK